MTWYDSIRNLMAGSLLEPYGERWDNYVELQNRKVSITPAEQILQKVGPPTFAEIRKNLYDTMEIRQNIINANGTILLDNIPGRINAIVGKMFANQKRYEKVSHKFPNPIRWYHIAIIHQMEGEMNFNTYLGNGQILSRKTTIVPKGRGPFSSWEAGAEDAVRQFGLNKIQDWSIGAALETLERWNGWGYNNKSISINSPYLWSGTNHYVKGKYVSDGKYSPTAVSLQIGAASILKKILERL